MLYVAQLITSALLMRGQREGTWPSAVRESRLRMVSWVQAPNIATMFSNQALWKAGTMARRRGFHVSRSAGISPLPIIGSRISASTPLS